MRVIFLFSKFGLFYRLYLGKMLNFFTVALMIDSKVEADAFDPWE